MKKLIAILVFCSLLFSFAYAEPNLMTYNINAESYGGQTFDESSMTENTAQRVTYSSGNKVLSFCAINSIEINSVVFISEPDADFLPSCVAAAMCLDPNTDNITTSFGILLYGYLMVNKGEDSYTGMFSNRVFTMKTDGQRFQFAVGKP